MKCWWIQFAAARALFLFGVAVVFSGVTTGDVLVVFAGGLGALIGELRSFQLAEDRAEAADDARVAAHR